ncbi:MAG TPA: hypothetical protein VK817_10100 [Trebonia sp.]|jgi:hypothetical protein|nr:hypothetical protein [Trebonia sp.]
MGPARPGQLSALNVGCEYGGLFLFASPQSAWEGTETVYLPHGDLDGEVLDAIHQAVPDGATYGFNHDSRRAWVTVTKPGDTREVLSAAFASLGRDLPTDPGS